MRNLKRALSLLLAAAMLIGMMVVGASAAGSLDDFSDKDEIVNQDAVSLLTILGVIEGKEDGSYFDPTGNVTRAEMAKMIATILNQGADVDGLYTGMNTGLTDVSGHWAESYINYCYSLGIIAGRGDGTFDPGATVTGTEAAKMLLVAAGYDASIEGLTGNDWAIRTAALASTLGIFDNLNAPTGDPLTRDNAALLVYNALDIEMIQSYQNGYAIAYDDNRTILSTKYGVYRLEGVVVGNEWAQLEGTDSDAALAEGKTRLSDIRLVDSDTVNTRPGVDDGQTRPDTTFNVSTSVDLLGQTVTMYVRNTTVLANSEVLGVYLKDGANTVVTSVETEDTMKDFLKGTGLSVSKDTEYYVNYGIQDSESDATAAMDFGKDDNHLDNVQGKTNGYGVELTAIDNDQDGTVDYVLYLQETLSQVIAKNSSKETTTINAFNDNKAIDDEDIVTEADPAEGDLVLVVSYGERYYVSEPETVTGQMESYQASKSKEQTIKVDGTDYHPSYIQYEANTADNTYEFDIQLCDDEGYTEGVQFDTDYDFILDSNGNVIAFQPSEQGLYDYALVLDSGYEPGAFASDASGKVRVLLADGTEGTYTLNFSASAKNVSEQIVEADPNANRDDYSKSQGIQELKGFLGTADSDLSSTAPWADDVNRDVQNVFADELKNDTDFRDGNAKGYVIGYSLNSDNVLTITSIVGTTKTGAPSITGYNPDADIDITGAMKANYNAGAGRISFGETGSVDHVAVDRNTVAFYCTFDGTDIDTYGVAVGYDEMTSVTDAPFVAEHVRSTTDLAGVVLFEAEGVQAEKDYVYVLSKNTVTSSRAVLNVVYMDGTVGEMTIDRDDYDDIFRRDSDFGTAYAYTTGTDGISKLTEADVENLPVIHGYAWQVNDGTVAVYSDKAMSKPIDEDTTYAALNLDGHTFSYKDQIWNVEDVDSDDEKAPAGSFSRNVGREVVLVLNSDCDKVRAAYIQDVLDGVYTSEFAVTANPQAVSPAGGVVATVTTNPASLSGTLSYEWFKADNASGDNAVSLKDNTDYTVASNGALSVKSGVLTEGKDYFYFVEVTRRETGKVPVTVSSMDNGGSAIKVTVGGQDSDLDVFATLDEINAALEAGNVTVNGSFTSDGRLTVPAGRTLTIKGDYTNHTDGDRINGTLIVEGEYTVNNNNIVGTIEANELTFGAGATAPVISGDVTLTGSSATVTVPSGGLTVNGSLTTANVDATNGDIEVGADGKLVVTNQAGLNVDAGNGIVANAGATIELGTIKYMGNTSEYLFTLESGSLKRDGASGSPAWKLTGAEMTVNQAATLTNDNFTLDGTSKITVAAGVTLTVNNVTISDGSKVVGEDTTAVINATNLTVTTGASSFEASTGTSATDATPFTATCTWNGTIWAA